MSIKRDPSGRRYVEVEVEVPGSPEEVWQAIATGPGVSSWFVPTEIETGENGIPVKVVAHFGPGMDSVAKVTSWEPPHRFAADSEDLGPGAPPVATEWIVEAKSGGMCVVRVVHSLFASTDDWDNQLEGFESGWPGFFRILKLYLTHFSGKPCSAFRAMGFAPEPVADAWDKLVTPLGLSGATKGGTWYASSGVPPFGGIVEDAPFIAPTGEKIHAFLLRLDKPAPGIASLFGFAMGGQVMLVMDFFLYGETAAAIAARDQVLWNEWMQQRFPMGG